MNDLIKRSDVEKMLTALGGCDASDKEAAGWDKAIDAAMEGLRKIESADRWIPCSERLPNSTFNVEVTTKDNKRTIGYYAGYAGNWYSPITDDLIFVKAWKEPSDPWEGEYKVKGRIVIEIEKIPKDCFSCVQVNEYGYCQWINKYIDCCSKIGERYPTCPIEPWEGE